MVDEDKRSTLRRFAAVGAAGPLSRLPSGDEDGSGSETRDAIAGYVSSTPGAHFSKLRDDLKLGTGEAQHHLRRLAEDGVVETHRDGDYRRFFPAGRFSNRERVALSYLRRETPRGMLRELLRNPEASGAALADALGVSRPTVSKYASELERVGLLSREDGYAVESPEMLVVLLVRYADSFDADTEAFASDAADFVTYDP